MDFSFKPKITKELILSKVSEESLFEHYLGVPVKKGLFISPLREDHYKTVSYYRARNGDLIFKDFATGQHLNIFGVVQELYHCNYWEALKIIANDIGLSKKVKPVKLNPNPVKITEHEMSIIQVEIQDFTELEIKWWSKFGITPEILKHFDVYSCKNVFLNGQVIAKSQQHCPIFGYYGNKYQGIELWKCYFPKRKSYRFIGNYPKNKIQGYNKLPRMGKMCVITKSLKDCMTLYSFGIPACAPNSETLFVSKVILDNLKKRFENIIVFYDNDRAGMHNMWKIRKEYPELEYVMIPKKYGSKDISDFYRDHGKIKTQNLIKEYVAKHSCYCNAKERRSTNV